jgi:hypothetical protein
MLEQLRLPEKSHCTHISNIMFTPVIPATQEAEIRRISVQSQTRQIVHKTLSQKKKITQKGWWSSSKCRP